MNRSTKWESDRSLCVVVSDEQLKAMFYGQRRRTFTRADSRAGNYSVLVASQNSYCVSECAHTCNAADLWQRRQAARKKRAEVNSSYVRAIWKTGDKQRIAELFLTHNTDVLNDEYYEINNALLSPS